MRYNKICTIFTTKKGDAVIKGKKEREPNFGPYLKKLRKEKRVTLREFCKKAGADPGNISKIERGVWPPPRGQDILERYARALDIQEASDDWYRFFDYAATDVGIIPKDILSDEELAKMLPVFFRTLRGQKPTDEEMKALLDKIKRS